MTLFLTCYRNSCPSLPTQAGFQEWKPSPPDSLTKYYREEQQEEADLGWKINKRGKMERREEFFRRFPPRDVWSWRGGWRCPGFHRERHASRNILENVVGPNEKLVARANTLVDSWQTARWTSDNRGSCRLERVRVETSFERNGEGMRYTVLRD